jgi:hypothetical protein
MSRIEVDPGGLQATGSQAVATGSDVSRLAGEVRGVSGAGAGGPPATENALQALAAAWGAGLAGLGQEIRDVGLAADAASALYLKADSASMCPATGTAAGG